MMDKENIVGAIIMALCCGLCGLTFWVIGSHAEKAIKPVNFWSGTSVDPSRVQDVLGYNHANAVMWKQFSVPFWIAAVLGILGLWGEIYIMISAILLTVACVPGLFWLIWRYKAIEKRYLQP